MPSILITGGAGFIGSHYVQYALDAYPEHHIINVDKLTYAGSLDNLKEIESHPRYTFVQIDIVDEVKINDVFRNYDIETVIHFAAESHVDNSISSPMAFVDTNVKGTFTLLHAAYTHWMIAPFTYKKGKEKARFVHISTDEVYGTLGQTGLFTEQTPYAPNSPYSATKASSDMLVRSYHHTYGLNTVTTNCSNNYGPKQHDEKLIPTIIRNALAHKPIPIYGDGKHVRDWLYVLDHCRGIDLALSQGRAGEVYNIGGGNEWNNVSIARQICEILDRQYPRADGLNYATQIEYVKDRAGHDRRYAIDSTKIQTELGWEAQVSISQGLDATVRWYVEKYNKGN